MAQRHREEFEDEDEFEYRHRGERVEEGANDRLLLPRFRTIQGRELSLQEVADQAGLSARRRERLVPRRDVLNLARLGIYELDLIQFLNCHDVLDLTISGENLNGRRLALNGNFGALTRLNLSSNQLSSIVEDFDLPNLYELDLSRNQLTTIDTAVFTKCPKLQYLELSVNQLSSIDVIDLPNLKSLDLDSNQLTIINTKVFEKCTSLTWLNLGSNKQLKIDSQNPFDFQYVSKLTGLRISGTELTCFTSKCFLNMDKAVQLTLLQISYNKLSSIEDLDFPNLEKLEISYTQLTTINTSVFRKCTKLKELILSNNQLRMDSENPFDFQYLSNLRRLQLGSNNLASLDSKSFVNSDKAVKLIGLGLGYNQLSSIEEEIVLPQLENLNLDNNRLTKIDTKVFKKCANLKRLFLSGNTLKIDTQNPFDFQNIANVERLDLDRNGMTCLNSKDLINMDKAVNLTRFNLRNNKLSSIEGEFDFPNVEEIYLSSNHLGRIDDSVFKKCTKLKNLDLSNNSPN